MPNVEVKESKEELKRLAKKYIRLPKILGRDDGVVYMECPVCKKSFARNGHFTWAYKIQSGYFCRYSCMLQAERVIEASKERRGRKSGENQSD